MGKMLRFAIGIISMVVVITIIGFSWAEIGKFFAGAFKSAFEILFFIRNLAGFR